MEDFLAQHQWLVYLAAPLTGAIMHKLNGNLKGFVALFSSAAVSLMVVGAWGFANGWHPAQWREAPLLVLMLLGWSSLTTTTLGEVKAKRDRR